MGPRIVLDACVLFPPLVRGIILGTAEAELLDPVWSQRILDEWRIAVIRKQGAEVEEEVIAIQTRMAKAFPNAQVAPDPSVDENLSLPDPADTHVLAAAIEAKATGVLTFNLRDFPRRMLFPYGVEAHHPDGFLWQIFSKHPDEMAPQVQRTMDAHGISPDRHRAALKRARLSRFGKAWDALHRSQG